MQSHPLELKEPWSERMLKLTASVTTKGDGGSKVIERSLPVDGVYSSFQPIGPRNMGTEIEERNYRGPVSILEECFAFIIRA